MIVEMAILEAKPGEADAMREGLTRARDVISQSKGFRSARLVRGIERPGTFLLLVEWETLEDHTEGFRGSPEYEQWRALLHHFYDPFPTVEHYESVTTD